MTALIIFLMVVLLFLMFNAKQCNEKFGDIEADGKPDYMEERLIKIIY